MFPAVPKAQDLPSAIQAINALTQIIMQLAAPGLAPFQNNLAPYTPAKLVGTPGIRGGAGANGSPGAAGKKGQDGENAQNPNWEQTGFKTEKVKVQNPDDNDQYVVVKRITEITFADQETGAQLTISMKAL
jgi:hypothetical protein